MLNQTPFYGESGGQVGDQGVIKGPKGALFRVTDTQKKLGDLFVHIGTVEKGAFKPGDAVELVVDHARRTATRANHSATHLLHEALRQVLGDARRPEGLAGGARAAALRLLSIQAHDARGVRGRRGHGQRVRAAELAGRDAPDGARGCQARPARVALFGEKYGEEVRVVSMGVGDGAKRPASDSSGKANKAWSVELCGGTHVERTGDIGLVSLPAESASAAGVRRIEALTAEGARDYLAQQDARMRELAGALRTKPDDVVERVKALMEERKQLERDLANAKRQLALGGGASQWRCRNQRQPCAPSARSS